MHSPGYRKIFAWASLDGSSDARGALAHHPDEYALSAAIVPTGANIRPYAIANKGLRITLPMIRKRGSLGTYVGVLDCHKQGNFLGQFGILLRPVKSADDNTFARSAEPPEIIEEWRCKKAKPREIYITKDSPLVRSEPRYAWIRRLPDHHSGFKIREISSTSDRFGTSGRTIEVPDHTWRGAILFEPVSKDSFVVLFGLSGFDQYSTIVHILSPFKEGTRTRLHTTLANLSIATLFDPTLLHKRRYIRKSTSRGTIIASITWDLILDKEVLIVDVSIHRFPFFAELKTRYEEMLYLPWRSLGAVRY